MPKSQLVRRRAQTLELKLKLPQPSEAAWRPLRLKLVVEMPRPLASPNFQSGETHTVRTSALPYADANRVSGSTMDAAEIPWPERPYSQSFGSAFLNTWPPQQYKLD